MRKYLLPLFLSAQLSGMTAMAAEEVNIYTLRQPELLEPILEAFTKETGIKVKATWVQDGILARLQAEGDKSPADVVLTVDVSRLSEISEAGLFKDTENEAINTKIPSHLRHPSGQWYTLTKRARMIVASKERVALEDAPQSYEDLADSQWKGKICTRSGKHVYNIGVISSMISAHGMDDAKIWLKALKDNRGRKPSGNDRAQARAIYEGVCDIALINSYYLGKMAYNDKETQQKDWYNALHVIFPNQEDRGAHINISGIGILKAAKNPENAEKLIEYLLGDEAQKAYADLNFEFPVISSVKVDALVQSWGDFKEDETPLQNIADGAAQASQLVDEVRFDF